MEIIFSILYRKEVREEDLRKISPEILRRVRSGIEKKLMTLPHVFGKNLRGSLFGFRSLRIGDYRIIFEIVLPKTVVIRAIQHRSRAYDEMMKRLREI
jgi:mRNA interferase RelE/StbE